MPIEFWSDSVAVVHLCDDPQFSDDMIALEESRRQRLDVVLDMAQVHYVNSSNISKLLKLRKQILTHGDRLLLCNLTTQVWGVFLVTGLDKVFGFTDSVPTALATLQMEKGDAESAPAST